MEEFQLVDFNKKMLSISSDTDAGCVWFQWNDHQDDICFKFAPKDACQIGKLLIEKAKELGVEDD